MTCRQTRLVKRFTDAVLVALLMAMAFFAAASSPAAAETTPTGVAFNPSSTYGGRASIGTVTLSAPADAAGIVVALSSTSSYVTVPASVTVPGGSSTATFSVMTSPVPATTACTVTAACNGHSTTGTLTLRPPYPAAVTFSHPTAAGGSSITGTVRLNVPAPPSGQVVGLSSDSAAVAVPAQVTVSAGVNTATFAVTSSPVSQSASITISAVCNRTTAQGMLTLVPPSPAALSFAPRALVGGNSTVGTVTLNGPTTSDGIAVQLSSGNAGAAQTPAQVVVPAGQSSATFTVTTSPASAVTYTTMTATASGGAVSATLMTGDNAITANPFDTDVAFTWRFAGNQLSHDIATIPTTVYPIYTDYTGTWVNIPGTKWTVGQYPGSLWLMGEQTGSSAYLDAAQTWTNGLSGEATDYNLAHDVGFVIGLSYGNAYDVTGDDADRQVMLTGAQTLAARFNPAAGVIKSRNTPGVCDVLIDNMMNLEILFWGAQHGGDPNWTTIASSHALQTMQNQVRPDGSTWQLVNYDINTGAVLSKDTVQGYSADSCWSRGQSWAVYGFTTAYRYTGDARFLQTAQATANYFLAHLPADSVPVYDFNAPAGAPKDSSAAAVTADALFELSADTSDPAQAAAYYNAAKTILSSLMSSAYLADGTTYQSLLRYGTYTYSAGLYDEGTSWGDYYFLEALRRYAAIPVPAITKLLPTSAYAGGGSLSLSVTGANFVSGAVVHFGTTALATTFVSTTQLTATITSALRANVATFNVTVLNPDSQTSGGQPFVVKPRLTALTLAATRVSGGQSVTATVTLNGPAPTGGIAIALTSSDTARATVPASVTVPANATSATFAVTTLAVTSTGVTNIGASGAGGTFSAPLTTLAPLLTTADTFGQDGSSANTNFGTVNPLLVKTSTGTGSNRDTYLKFSLSGVTSVTSAKLLLTASLSGSGSQTSGVFGTSSGWTEGGLTWNTRPALGSSLGSVTVSGTSAAVYSVDVTSYVQSQVSGGVASFGLHNPSVSTLVTRIVSRELGTGAAQLIITGK